MSHLTDPDRSPLVEAQMILMGLTGLQPTKAHLEALDEHYQVMLINIANDLESVKKRVLNG